jgi:hypothetical protein
MLKISRGMVWTLLCVGGISLLASAPSPGLSAGPADGAPGNDPALDRARAQARMLDDLFKVAVVDITNRYDGPPAVKVAKSIFAAAKEKHYFDAKLLDATGSPLSETNVPGDGFEKRAAEAMNAGKTYHEEVVGKGESRRLRVATVVPAVTKKCAACHGVKQGDLLGFLSYDLPVK